MPSAAPVAASGRTTNGGAPNRQPGVGFVPEVYVGHMQATGRSPIRGAAPGVVVCVGDPHVASGWARPVIAALSLGASAIHFAVVGEHYAEYALFGLMFAALAWFQAGWALWFLARPGRRLALAAVVVNIGVLAVWAASRTTGLPIGPRPWTAEAAGPLDLAATTFEVVLVMVLLWSPRPAEQPASARRPGAQQMGLVTAAGFAIVALATSSALGLSGGRAHRGDDDHLHAATAGHHPDHRPIGDAGQTAGPPISSSGATVVEPPVTSSGATGSPSPGPSSTTLPAATSPGRPAEPPGAWQPEPGSILFATDLDAAGRIAEPVQAFELGARAVWRASLSRPAGVDEVRLVIVQPMPDGRESAHWSERLERLERGQRTIVSTATLSDFSHGGTGRYVMRYVAGDEILAEGTFELTR